MQTRYNHRSKSSNKTNSTRFSSTTARSYNNPLENLVQKSEEKKEEKPFTIYPQPYLPNTDPSQLFDIRPVSAAELPPHVLGVFNTRTKRGAYSINQNDAEKYFTREHETQHAVNNYRGVDDPEILADMQAIANGASPFLRPPEFYEYN
jgi:hypothetical protein